VAFLLFQPVLFDFLALFVFPHVEHFNLVSRASAQLLPMLHSVAQLDHEDLPRLAEVLRDYRSILAAVDLAVQVEIALKEEHFLGLA